MKTVLITGGAGFIGFSLIKSLLSEKKLKIINIDNLNNYYDVKLKQDRLKILKNLSKINSQNYKFIKGDLSDRKFIEKIFRAKIDYVINLAAQAGVRYSLENPDAYFDSNIVGFYNLIKKVQEKKIKHFVFASSSSVYGESEKYPTSEKNTSDFPIQFYAATKKCNEVIAHSYSKLYNLRITGVRFFTVYGPWDRPDMAIQKFSKSILKKNTIKIFNNGKHFRSFSYIDDVVENLKKIIFIKNKKKYNLLNIGSSKSVALKKVINLIGKNLNLKPNLIKIKKQKGDVFKTQADVSLLRKYTKLYKETSIEEGLKKHSEWIKSYYI